MDTPSAERISYNSPEIPYWCASFQHIGSHETRPWLCSPRTHTNHRAHPNMKRKIAQKSHDVPHSVHTACITTTEHIFCSSQQSGCLFGQAYGIRLHIWSTLDNCSLCSSTETMCTGRQVQTLSAVVEAAQCRSTLGPVNEQPVVTEAAQCRSTMQQAQPKQGGGGSKGGAY